MTRQGEIATNEAFANLEPGTFTTGTWQNRILATKNQLETLQVSATSNRLNSARRKRHERKQCWRQAGASGQSHLMAITSVLL